MLWNLNSSRRPVRTEGAAWSAARSPHCPSVGSRAPPSHPTPHLELITLRKSSNWSDHPPGGPGRRQSRSLSRRGSLAKVSSGSTPAEKALGSELQSSRGGPAPALQGSAARCSLILPTCLQGLERDGKSSRGCCVPGVFPAPTVTPPCGRPHQNSGVSAGALEPVWGRLSIGVRGLNCTEGLSQPHVEITMLGNKTHDLRAVTGFLESRPSVRTGDLVLQTPRD